MRELSGAEMRREYNLVMEALTEKFLKDDDATLVLGKFLEDANNCLSTIRSLYNQKAKDREEIIKPSLQEMDKLSRFLDEAHSQLMKHVNGTTAPEDDNQSIGA